VTDIIELIDEVTAPSCGSCGAALRPDGPSADYCGETCADAWRRQHGEPLGPDTAVSNSYADVATGYRLPCGRRLAVQHDTSGFEATPKCRVIERFPMGDKFSWIMPLSQWTELAADPVALETIWDQAIRSDTERAQRRTFPDGSWDVTDQNPPWHPGYPQAGRREAFPGWEWRGTANNCHVVYTTTDPDLVLYVRPIHRPECVGVELVDADGRSYIHHVTR
jgi:hypothetical protein